MSEQIDREKLRDPSGLWGALRLFAILYIVAQILLGLEDAGELFADQLNTALGPDASQLAVALLAIVGGFGSLIVLLICIVLTCRITYRMMRNLHILGSTEAQITPAWAVGWYFIPFANLVMPVRAVGQMWRGTFGEIGEYKDSGVIGLWWGAWILDNIVGNIATRMSMSSGGFSGQVTDPALYRTSLWVGLADAPLDVIAALLFLSVFGQLTKAQRTMLQTESMR